MATAQETATKMARERILESLRKAGKAPVSNSSGDKDGDEHVIVTEELFLDQDTNGKAGRIMYSDMFIGAPEYLKATGKPDIDMSTLVHKPEDWDEEDRVFIPKLDEFYVWQHDVTYPAVLGLLGKLKVLFVGPTGSGKTTFHENMAAKLCQPFYLLGGRGDLESDFILGRQTITEGTMQFVLGEFTKALVKEYYILMDEIWKVPSSINMAFQRLLQRNGFLQIDDADGNLCDKQFFPGPRSIIQLADNVVGTGDGAAMYGATQIQDGSTLNRVDLILRVDYLPQADEVAMLMARYSEFLPESVAKKAVQVANKIRAGFEQGELSAGMSPRNLFAWMELAQKVRNYEEAFKWVMLNRFADDAEKGAVRGFYELAFAKTV